MYCLIYGESKLFMNIVYAFIIIDLICVRCMEQRIIIGNMLYTGV